MMTDGVDFKSSLYSGLKLLKPMSFMSPVKSAGVIVEPDWEIDII